MLHWTSPYYWIYEIHDGYRTTGQLGIIFQANNIGVPLDMGEMAVNVIYKGGASNIAQMSLCSIYEMFGMSKY